MRIAILVLCDERDLPIGAAVRAELVQRGHDATLETCDAAEEGLGPKAREALPHASKVVVVVREGGRGNRLLHAAEDEAPKDTTVVSLIADGSPDGSVSARTHARIEALGDTLSPRAAAPKVAEMKRGMRKRLVAMIAGGLALFGILAVVLWLRGPAAPLVGGPPVVLTGMLSNAGWMVQFHLREDASTLEYKLPFDPDYVSTGDMGPTSGPDRDKPHAKLFVILPEVQDRMPIQVRYRTLSGASRGPYEVIFDPNAEAVASVKKILTDVPEWISFRPFNGRKLCYFSMLLTYKYALRSIRYGLDSQPLNRSVRFAPRGTPGIDNNDELYIDLPEDTSSVTVELVFRDGTTQQKRFPVRY